MNPQSNRRDLLKLAAASIAALATPSLASAAASASDTNSPFPKPATPEEALHLLVKGNERYLAETLTSCSANMAHLRHASEAHQEPFAAILSCADSRVPDELVFDQSLGTLFVVRVAGNIAAPDTIASLEYAAAAVGVKLILVLGHTACGAVKATAANEPVPGQISTLFQYIRPALAGTTDLTEGSRRNATLQAKTLSEASPVLADLIAKNKLLIQPAIYDVSSGKVTLH
ncbi:MAG: carbonic anhydrase [Acidobacteriota bacterium]